MNSSDQQNSEECRKTGPTFDEKRKEREEEDRSVDEASRESFPASDSPAWSIPEKRKKLRQKPAK